MREELWEERIQEGSNDGSYREEGGFFSKGGKMHRQVITGKSLFKGNSIEMQEKKLILRTVKHQPGCSDLFLLGNIDDNSTRSHLA